MHPNRSVACLLLACLLLGGCGDPDATVVADRAADEPPATGDVPVPTGAPAAAGGPVVDVAGAVHRPGVYRMEPGARVHEAIEAAGGATARADLSVLNRAAVLVDGQQVVVARAGDAAAAGGSATTAGAPSGGPAVAVSINVADVAALDTLPGIGPVTAERIVAERDAGGPYIDVDDLDRVPGIGPATIESLRDLVTA